MRRWVLVAGLLAATAWAQADLPDAGLPDASLDGTGAERASEEQEDSMPVTCLLDRDCDRGFTCANGRCTWQRYRDATFVGCVSAPAWPAFALGLLALRYLRVKRTK